MAAHLDSEHRIQSAKRVIVGAAAGLGMLAGILLVANWVVSAAHPGGISCADCAEGFHEYHDYLAGAASIGEKGWSDGMKEHLEACSVCRQKFQARYPNVLPTLGIQTPGSSRFAVFALALPDSSCQ